MTTEAKTVLPDGVEEKLKDLANHSWNRWREWPSFDHSDWLLHELRAAAETGTRVATPTEPHWEHGYRCHGYWLGNRRIGFIGICSGRGAAAKYGYGWSMDYPRDKAAFGRSMRLRSARRAVERAYREATHERT
jgi:hypothetical protein